MLPTISTGNVASALAGEYEVANSCRFDDGSNDNLERTQDDGNKKTWTTSWWVKRANLGINTTMWDAGTSGGNNYSPFFFQSDDTIRFYEVVGGSLQSFNFITNRVFRDTSAWYHIVYRVDTTQSTEADRVRLYINGVQETSFSTSAYPAQDYNTTKNNSSYRNTIGTAADNDGNDLDAYLAEFVHVDGQSLEPTSFGEFDEDSPTIWKPIDVSGLTFGTNGFHLDFENASSLGADVSGNSNNFTVNNLTSVDQSTDTCTNNFATLNPLEAEENSPTFSDGNLTQTTPNSGASGGRSTIEIPHTGVWYWEVKIVSTTGTIGDNLRLGISNDSPSSNSGQLIKYMSDGQSQIPGSSSSYGASYAAGDIIGIKVDADNNQVTFYKNGATQGAISYTMVDGETYKAVVGEFSNTIGCVYSMNFGNAPFSISSGNSDPNGYGNFEYSTDSGYALNTKNLAEFG